MSLNLHTGPDFPDAGQGWCCLGAAMHGPRRCTCWVPVYDLDQAEPDTQWGPPIRPTPCDDCAYRHDSPERRNDESVAGDAGLLEGLTHGDSPFFCHDGIRRPLRWEHRPEDVPPTNVSIPGSPADYDPPIIDGVPYRASGEPAYICAGWAARRDRVINEEWEDEIAMELREART